MLPATATRTDLGYLASRHRIGPFSLHRPVTAAEAYEVLNRYGTRAVAMGGGVDLSNRLKSGERIDHIVYLRDASDLTRIVRREGWLRVGAAVTHQQFTRDPAVGRALPDLVMAWHTIGNPRVRAAGTLGGNLITAAPHYDVGPLVAAAGARLIYEDKAQRLLSHIDFPIDGRLALGYETAYKPVVSVAVAALQDTTGSWRGRAVVGCAYPEPATAALRGTDDVGELVDASRELARSVCQDLPAPVDDHVASAAYRRRLIEVLVRRLLAEIGTRLHSQGEPR